MAWPPGGALASDMPQRLQTVGNSRLACAAAAQLSLRPWCLLHARP